MIVEVIEKVLENEEDEDGNMVVMKIIKDIMKKEKDILMEKFDSIGVL
jgi:hypothetical protein